MKNYVQYFFRYRKLLREIETMRIYDGRGKGVDVYTCEESHHRIYTYYRDKGVTPFYIACDNKKYCDLCGRKRLCHRDTIRRSDVPRGFRVLAWYRPSFWEMIKLPKGLIWHVLDGRLILEGRNYE